MPTPQKVSAQINIGPTQQIETCARCGNAYLVIWIKEGHDYNDFGERYCPFCGLMTEEFVFRMNQ
jgi:hypothetical protein